MIDSHCHFDFSEFHKDRESVWHSAQQNGVDALLIPATEFDRFVTIQKLVQQHSSFYYALGLHPWFLHSDSPSLLPKLTERIEASLQESQFVAVGETGLDFAIEVLPELQELCFVHQLHLAQQYSLPVIIHHRKSHNRIIQILRKFPGVVGVIHAFTGSEQEAKTYVDMGFYLGVGGTITYERAHKTKKALKAVGVEHLLLETDAPAMPVSGKQGQRNSPEYLPHILSSLAEVLESDIQNIQQRTTANFYRLFNRARA